MTHSIIRKISLIALVLLLSLPVSAQDDPTEIHPMLDLLSYVPDTPEVRSEFYYADLRASIETRLGTRQFRNNQEWDLYPEDHDVWQAALPRIMPSVNNFSFRLDDNGETTGLNYFSIERMAWFGEEESFGIAMQGDFATDAIITAYTARGWEITRNDESMQLLCSTAGCGEGSFIDFAYRNDENPFGGTLGRREPIALLDNHILNAQDFAILETMLGTLDGSQLSLGIAPDVQAAVRTLTRFGSIRQAAIFNHEELVVNALPLTLPPDVRAAMAAQIQEVPIANLVMIADTANALVESGHMLFLYEYKDDAITAQEALTRNLSRDSVIVSAQLRIPVRQTLELRGILQPIELIQDDVSGYFMVLVSVQSSLTIGDAQYTNGELIPSGRQFVLFFLMAQARDVYWFAYSRP